MGLVLSHMGSEKIYFGFFLIWGVFGHLGFVKYGRQDLSHMGCTEGFVIYGQYSAATTLYEQSEVRLG